MQIELQIFRDEQRVHTQSLSVGLSNRVRVDWVYQHGDQLVFNYVEPQQGVIPLMTIFPDHIMLNFNLVQVYL